LPAGDSRFGVDLDQRLAKLDRRAILDEDRHDLPRHASTTPEGQTVFRSQSFAMADDPDAPAGISLKTFMASTIHTVFSGPIRSPTFANGADSGLLAR
jgi:hypothetical protein